MIDIKEPRIIKNFFEDDYFNNLKNYFENHEIVKQDKYHYYGSKRIDSFNDPVLKETHEKMLPKIKEIFGVEDILPTYAVFAEYSGEQAYLDKHKDIGPCTYTIDLCLYQKTGWDIMIEGKSYSFVSNEAIAFYPNHQDHWREEFPDPENNKVAIILFSYAPTDHDWWKIPENVRPLLRDRVKPL